MEKRRNCSSFPQYFQYIFNFKSLVTHIHVFVKCGCSIYFFLKSANQICRSTDILKYFRESLGIRDNESRLYIVLSDYCFNCNLSFLFPGSPFPLHLTLVLLNPDIPCLCKQCRSRSVGFWRSQLIWICTVCHGVCEFISTTWIK